MFDSSTAARSVHTPDGKLTQAPSPGSASISSTVEFTVKVAALAGPASASASSTTPAAVQRPLLARVTGSPRPWRSPSVPNLETSTLPDAESRGVPPTLAPTAGEVALAGFDEHGLLAAEVAHGDGAAGDLGEGAVAAVGGHPDGAAHGRGRVLAARAEAALGVCLELADRAARELRRRRTLAALGGAGPEAGALEA